MRIIVHSRQPTVYRQPTAHLIELQTLFFIVTGKKAANHQLKKGRSDDLPFFSLIL